MSVLIKNAQVINDDWTLISDKSLTNISELPQGRIIVPMSLWQSQASDLSTRSSKGELGLWLDSDEHPESIKSDLANFAVIAINFPVFSDGRGYSYARILRDNYQFKGELRAIGNMLIDQLFFMKRCGFDAFAFKDEDTAQAALSHFETFTHCYQSGADNPEPLFLRRR